MIFKFPRLGWAALRECVSLKLIMHRQVHATELSSLPRSTVGMFVADNEDVPVWQSL